ncbi:MAG TPA: PD-(D/E)XK nuclease family protein [Albitalea sp.]|nr:PD-(D/E)XK nuclease family protein [Albitalea sp.]
MRDAIVLVPFAQQLAPARQAWSALGGWLPRIETTQTLARSLAPPQPTDAAQISFDTALDRLGARRLMNGQGWGQAWRRRDPRGFEHAVNAVVQTAQAFARAAAAVAPGARAAYWARGRELLSAGAGPGGTERLLARVAFEWAAANAAAATDLLFALRPSAWIAVQAGGPDALAAALLSHDAGIPALLIDADPPAEEPFARLPAGGEVCIAVCEDFEAEAQRAAAAVVAHLNAGRRPVALIAQDRLLMRRVRALLARRQVPILDETGWKLSTTRAGAAIVLLLRVAHARACADDWLDWLKSCASAWPGREDAAWAVQVIEASMRREGWVAAAQVDASRLPEAAATLWRDARHLVARFGAAGSRSFVHWLRALQAGLDACGAWASLQEDDAGRQAIAALHLDEVESRELDDAETMSLDEFAAWVDDALEDAAFVPQPSVAAADAPVVITPLAQSMLRPFAAAVLPGADEKRLGGAPSPHPLLGEALVQALGLPGAPQRRDAQALALAQLLRVPRLDFLRRLDDGGEPLAPSPLLERLRLAMARAGRGDFAPVAQAFIERAVEPRPALRPQPAAPALLPSRLSASACEALRACPYRFFALRLLSLREADELDDVVEKRDYGTWLHAVLHRFHQTRAEPLPAAQEEARLHAIAQAIQHEMRLDDAAFLPFAATFVRFAPRYVQWLRERDAQGAQWLEGEREFTASPPEWGGIEMHGVIDRIDSVSGDDGPVTQLIDYKTGSAQLLRQQVRLPQEDTQLAFYAALVAQQSQAGGELEAIYLPLDDADGIRPIEHPHVEASAQQLVEGIGRDIARLRAGAAMPALGEGSACEFCEARGLCRRDHWPPREDR